MDDDIPIIEDEDIIVTWPPDNAQTTPQLDYVVDVATTERALNNDPDIARHCIAGQREVELNHLPLNGTKVYIRLWKKVNGVWEYEDFEIDTPSQIDAKQQITRSYIVHDHLSTPRFAYDDKKTTHLALGE